MSSLRSLALEALPVDLGVGRVPPRLGAERLRVGRVAGAGADERAWSAFAGLIHLRIDACAERALPSALWRLGGLVQLELKRVELDDELPEAVHALTALSRLHLSDWPRLWRVQLDLERLGDLERLELHALPQLGDLRVLGDRPHRVLTIDALDVPTRIEWEEAWPAEPDRADTPAIRFRSRFSPRLEAELIAELEALDVAA